MRCSQGVVEVLVSHIVDPGIGTGRRRFLSRAAPRLILSIALAAIATGVVAQPAQARRRPDCTRRGVTVIANAAARVFRVGSLESYRAYVCYLKSRKTRVLGTFDDGAGGGATGFRLNGDFVAFDNHICDQESCRGSVTIINSRTGAIRRSASETRNSSFVTDLVLDAAGNVAWIRYVELAPDQATYEVRKLDSSGEVVVDSDPGIERGSLALAKTRIYWTKRGQPFSALLG